MADQLIPDAAAAALLAALDSAPGPAAAVAAVRALLAGETIEEYRRRLVRERVRRCRARRREGLSTAPLHSVTPAAARAIHSVTRVTPHASGPTSPTSDDAPEGVTGNALQRYPPHPQPPGPPSGGPGGAACDADRVTAAFDPAECQPAVATKPAQVRWARAAAGLRARPRDWSDARCSAAVTAAADQHGAPAEDCWRALAWLAAQPGTRAPGLLRTALPRALAAIERSDRRPHTTSPKKKTSSPATAATTRSSRATNPAPAPTADRSDPWTTRSPLTNPSSRRDARTASAGSTDPTSAAAALVTAHPSPTGSPSDDPFQLTLPMSIPGGGQLRPTTGMPDWAREAVARVIGRRPDGTRATPAYRPTHRARRTSAA
jgi:hypothetical protein